MTYRSPLQNKLDAIIKSDRLDAWEMLRNCTTWDLLIIASYVSVDESVPPDQRPWIKKTAEDILDLRPAELN